MTSNTKTNAPNDTELTQLRRRVAELEAQHNTLQTGETRHQRLDEEHARTQTELETLRTNQEDLRAQLVQALQQVAELRTFYILVENIPDGVSLARLDGSLIYVNAAYRALVGYTDALPKISISNLIVPEERDRTPDIVRYIMEHGSWQGLRTYQRQDGQIRKIFISSVLIRDTDGQPRAFGSIVRDVTEQLSVEQERQALQEQVIMAQKAALAELSIPLIPIADNIVAMPLIGSIDSTRATQMLETLLHGVAAHHAKTAIIDITGVPVVDTQVANTLVHAAQAVQLLGAQVVLTGIRPEVAQTLVGLGMNLTTIVTRSTLQSGIGYALTRR